MRENRTPGTHSLPVVFLISPYLHPYQTSIDSGLPSAMENNRLDRRDSFGHHTGNNASANHAHVSNPSGSIFAAAVNTGAYNEPDSADGWKNCLDIMDENDKSMLSALGKTNLTTC